jgi:mannitol/fructose-specific phosphotransferase system IIA component (Ntr-type)
MKKLYELMSEKKVVLDFRAGSKKEAMERLIDPVAGGAAKTAILASLMEREELGTTGIGFGVAVPHVRQDSITEPVVVFGRSAKPLDFDAMDGAPCSLFFLVMGPVKSDAQESYLHAMAKISRLMRQPQNRERLMKAASVADVMTVVREGER